MSIVYQHYPSTYSWNNNDVTDNNLDATNKHISKPNTNQLYPQRQMLSSSTTITSSLSSDGTPTETFDIVGHVFSVAICSKTKYGKKVHYKVLCSKVNVGFKKSNWDKRCYLFQMIQNNVTMEKIDENTPVKKIGSQGVTVSWPFTYDQNHQDIYIRFVGPEHTNQFLEKFMQLQNSNKLIAQKEQWVGLTI
jgi:hypothetical protein